MRKLFAISIGHVLASWNHMTAQRKNRLIHAVGMLASLSALAIPMAGLVAPSQSWMLAGVVGLVGNAYAI